jgi:TM2 domain-containing membrane protein YozV
MEEANEEKVEVTAENTNTNTTTNSTNNNTTNNTTNHTEVSKKNRLTAMVLCILLGFFGVHRLYAGKLGTGFLMLYGTIVSIAVLMANIPIGLMCLVTMGAFVANDLAVLAFGQFMDCYGKTMSSNELH